MPYGDHTGVYYIVNAQDLGYAVIALTIITLCIIWIMTWRSK